jgi:hypothetical protein
MIFCMKKLFKILVFFCLLKTTLLLWNRTKRFDLKPAYFNFDLKHYDDFSVISNHKVFKKYGFKLNECDILKKENYQYIYFMRKNEWRDYRIINFNFRNIQEMHKTRNNNIKFWTWSNMVKFFIMNSNTYALKRFQNWTTDVAKMNSIYKLSEFYLTLSVCTLTSNSNYIKYLEMFKGRFFPSPCSRELCYFIFHATRDGICQNDPIPIYENNFKCKCKEGFEFKKGDKENSCILKNKNESQKIINCKNNGTFKNEKCNCLQEYDGPDCSIQKLSKRSHGNLSIDTSLIDLSECISQFRNNISTPSCIQLIANNSFCDYKCLNGYCINNSW